MQAAKIQGKIQEANHEYFDKYRRRWEETENHVISAGNLILMHDTQLDISHSHKLSDLWIGPYKVTDVTWKHTRGTYKLAELDGTELEGSVSGDRVEKLIARTGF